MEINPEITVCFTGHRPKGLKMSEKELKKLLLKEIEESYKEGYRNFICGMAQGTDIYAGEILRDIKLKYPESGIKVICAIPYYGFKDTWQHSWIERFRNVFAIADMVNYTDGLYSPDVFQRRNMWMVDNSNKVIGVYNGEPSGTRNTLEYAQKKNKTIKIIPCPLT